MRYDTEVRRNSARTGMIARLENRNENSISAYEAQRKKDDEHELPFTNRDREILHSMEPVMDGIAGLLGDQCEVVLYSLEGEEHSVIRILNGHISGRGQGAPLPDAAMKLLRAAGACERDVLPACTMKAGNGTTLRSVTSLIRNDSGRPIGVLDINLNLDAPLLSILQTFFAGDSRKEAETNGQLVMNAEETVRRSVQEAMCRTASAGMKPNLARNKAIVRELFSRGIFDIRGAVDLVAREMGVSRYTVYNYLREARC